MKYKTVLSCLEKQQLDSLLEELRELSCIRYPFSCSMMRYDSLINNAMYSIFVAKYTVSLYRDRILHRQKIMSKSFRRGTFMKGLLTPRLHDQSLWWTDSVFRGSPPALMAMGFIWCNIPSTILAARNVTVNKEENTSPQRTYGRILETDHKQYTHFKNVSNHLRNN